MDFYFHETDRDVLILRADAAIDSHRLQQFLNELQRLLKGGARKLIVDCSHLEYLSSVGITALIRVRKRVAESGGQLKLAELRPPLQRLLEITRLDEVFEMYPSLEEARLAFRSTHE
jgi:anti-sigma B factor antagonist